MDILVIILIAGGLFAMGLLISRAFSIFSAWKKARKFGLNPSFSESLALTKFYQLEEDFLRSCKEFKDSDSTLSIVDIVGHHMADGDTKSLLSEWKKLKNQNLKLSFSKAVLLHLDAKDLLLAALEQNKTYNIDLEDKWDNTFPFHYSCEFKISADSSAWVEIDLIVIQEKIKEEIFKAFEECEISKLDSLHEIIETNYLNLKFWKLLCHGEVIHQEFKLLNQSTQ